MRITETQLRSIIKEEYLRSTPVRPYGIMSEARAQYLTEEMLDEGLWNSIKALAAGVKGGAGAALKPLGDAVGKAATQAKETATAAAKSISALGDKAKTAAAQAAFESMKSSVESSIKSSMQNGLKELVKAGMSEDEAKAFAGELVAAAVASSISA